MKSATRHPRRSETEFSKTSKLRHRAAIIADEGEQRAAALEFSEGPEGAEMRSLIARCNVGRILDCVRGESRRRRGRLRTPAALRDGESSNPSSPHSRRRSRPSCGRAGFTPAPSNVQGNQQPIIPAVFPQSCAEFIGVDMPTVPVGDAIFPVLSTSVAPGTPAKNANQATSEAAFSAEKLSPGRIQVAFFYSREDRASLLADGRGAPHELIGCLGR